jgi:hypothetical protein
MACTGASLAFYFTVTEVAYKAMTFFHRRFRNLHEVPILSLTKQFSTGILFM